MVIETIVVSSAVLVARKGKFSSLRRLRINGWYLLIFSAILQGLLSRGIIPMSFHYITIISTYVLLIICLLLNIRRLSMKIILIGIILNFIIIALNSGYMPVSLGALGFAGYDISTITSGILDTFHSVLNKDTLAPLLGDYIPIPEPYWFPQIWSIGDLFLIVGIFLFVQDLKPNSNSNAKN
jgi:hypothetical protein